jgi:hypothetical protein
MTIQNVKLFNVVTKSVDNEVLPAGRQESQA